MGKQFLAVAMAGVMLMAGRAASAAPSATPHVRMVTSDGVIELVLYPAKAPKTVANFLRYVRSGFYNGTIFHRVMPGFMIQGGGLTQNLTEKPTRGPIPDESANGLKNQAGTIAMARTADPQSATAQFFINTVTNPFLDYQAPTPAGYGYCVFGRVIHGMSVVHKIEATPTTTIGPLENVPTTPVIIRSMSVIGLARKPVTKTVVPAVSQKP